MTFDHRMIVSAIQLMKIDKREFRHLEWGACEGYNEIIMIIFVARTMSEAGRKSDESNI
jgi:hypothetical protein